MTAILSYFDLKRSPGTARENESAVAPPDPVWQYVPLAAGVAAGPFVHEYIAGHHLNLQWTDAWQQMILGLLLAFVLFPAVYRNAFDPDRSFFMQLFAVFTVGIGWQALFHAALHGAT